MLFFVVLVVLFVFGCSECRLNAGFLLFFIFFCKKFLHLFLFFAIMDITPPLRSGSVKTPGGVSYGGQFVVLGFFGRLRKKL